MFKIYYISDVHLDYKTPNELMKFLSLFNTSDTYIIVGDFYNDYVKSKVIIDILEKKKIKGYFTLGNHEYIHLFEPVNVDPEIKKSTSINDSMFNIPSEKQCDLFLQYFKNITKDNKYFKFLHTGKVFSLNNKWKLIGDTGWSSFTNKTKKLDAKEFKKYEWNHVTNWKWCEKQNKKFINFANSCIKKYKNLVIATHHPLYIPNQNDIKQNPVFNIKKSDEILFWYSKQEIIKHNSDVIFIHGHAHTIPLAKNNYVNAIGRKKEAKTISLEELELK